MIYRMPYTSIGCALAWLCLSFPPLYAQGPVVPAPSAASPLVTSAGTANLITQAQADQKVGHFAEALALLQAPPSTASAADTTALQLAVADVQFDWAESQWSHMSAVPHYQAAFAIDQTLRPAQAAGDLNAMGLTFRNLSLYSKAIDCFQQALTRFRQVGDKEGQEKALMHMGLAYRYLSRYDKAVDVYRQALPLMHQLYKDRGAETSVLLTLGIIYDEKLHQYKNAINSFDQARAICQQTRDKNTEAGALVDLGTIYHEARQYHTAIAVYRQASLLYQETADKDGEAISLFNTGLAYDNLRQYRQANSVYRQALSLYKQAGDKDGEARTRRSLERRNS